MNGTRSTDTPKRYWPLGQLVLARIREFYREPEAIFWVYGFPILIAVALGFAFRNKPVDRITVSIQQTPGARRPSSSCIRRSQRTRSMSFTQRTRRHVASTCAPARPTWS